MQTRDFKWKLAIWGHGLWLSHCGEWAAIMGGCSHVGLNGIALDSPLNLALDKSHRQLRRNLPSAPGTVIEGYGWTHQGLLSHSKRTRVPFGTVTSWLCLQRPYSTARQVRSILGLLQTESLHRRALHSEAGGIASRTRSSLIYFLLLFWGFSHNTEITLLG